MSWHHTEMLAACTVVLLALAMVLLALGGGLAVLTLACALLAAAAHLPWAWNEGRRLRVRLAGLVPVTLRRWHD